MVIALCTAWTEPAGGVFLDRVWSKRGKVRLSSVSGTTIIDLMNGTIAGTPHAELIPAWRKIPKVFCAELRPEVDTSLAKGKWRDGNGGLANGSKAEGALI